MMNCRQFQEDVADFVSGRLDPIQSARMLAHSDQCDACAQAVQAERRLSMRFADAPPLIEMPDLLPAVTQRLIVPPPRRFALPRFWVYGSSLLATGIAVALFYVSRPETPTQPLGSGSPKGPEATASKPVESHPYVTMVNEIHQIGVDESDMLMESTHASDQLGFPKVQEGDAE